MYPKEYHYLIIYFCFREVPERWVAINRFVPADFFFFLKCRIHFCHFSLEKVCFTKILLQSKLLAVKRFSYKRCEHRVNSVSFKTSLKALVSFLEMLFVVTLSDELWYPGREKKVAECWKSLSFCIFALHQVKQSETVTIPIEVSRHFLCFCVWRSFVNLDCRAEFQHSSEELTVEWLNSTTHEQSNKTWKRRARLGRGFFSSRLTRLTCAWDSRATLLLLYSKPILRKPTFLCSLTHWRIPKFF